MPRARRSLYLETDPSQTKADLETSLGPAALPSFTSPKAHQSEVALFSSPISKGYQYLLSRLSAIRFCQSLGIFSMKLDLSSRINK